MKKSWTSGEKWLWLTPILIGIFLVAANVGTKSVHRLFGGTESLTTNFTSIRSMALSANGAVLAAGGMIDTKAGWQPGSGTVYLWNAKTAAPLAAIPPVYTRDKTGFINGFDIYALALSPNGRQVGFTRAALKIWALYDVATQKQLWQFPEFISDAVFSRDGRSVALSEDKRIYIVDTRTGKVKLQWKRRGSAYSQALSWSPDGDLIAIIGDHKQNDPIELYRAKNGRLTQRVQRPAHIRDEMIGSVKFSPDSRKFVIASSISSSSSSFNPSKYSPVRCYETSTGRLLWSMKPSTFGSTNSMDAMFCDAVFSPDGRLVVAYQYWKKKVFLLDVANGEVKSILKVGSAEPSNFFVPPGLLFAPDGKRLFARGANAILFWNLP